MSIGIHKNVCPRELHHTGNILLESREQIERFVGVAGMKSKKSEKWKDTHKNHAALTNSYDLITYSASSFRLS
jgi:hypothetical protein